MRLIIEITLDEKGLKLEGHAKHADGESIVTHFTTSEQMALERYTKHTVAQKVGYIVQDLMDESKNKLQE